MRQWEWEPSSMYRAEGVAAGSYCARAIESRLNDVLLPGARALECGHERGREEDARIVPGVQPESCAPSGGVQLR
jgi:hypothetical protein